MARRSPPRPRSRCCCCKSQASLSSHGRPAATASFVWREGGETSGNVYGSFPALYSALTAAGAGLKTVAVDNTITTPTIPPGTYQLQGVQFFGSPPQVNFSPLNMPVIVQEGARLVDTQEIGELLAFLVQTNDPAQPAFVFSTSKILFLSRGGTIDAQGSAPAMAVSAGQQAAVLLTEGAGFFASGGGPAIALGGGNTFILYSPSAAEISNNLISGDASNFVLFLWSAATGFDITSPLFPALAPIALASMRLDQAFGVNYIDFLTEPFGGTGLDNVQAFLDRIKSLAVIEQSDTVLAPIQPLTGSAAAQPMVFNPTPHFSGALYSTLKRLRLAQIMFRVESSAPGDSVQIAIYQRPGGNFPFPGVGGNMTLLSSVVVPVGVSFTNIVATLPQPIDIETGTYLVLWGQFAGGVPCSLLGYGVTAIELLNASVTPGKTLLVFDTTQNSDAAAPPQFNPADMPPAQVALMQRPLVLRGGN